MCTGLGLGTWTDCAAPLKGALAAGRLQAANMTLWKPQECSLTDRPQRDGRGLTPKPSRGNHCLNFIFFFPSRYDDSTPSTAARVTILPSSHVPAFNSCDHHSVTPAAPKSRS